MTADELRRLAEIAGLKFHNQIMLVKISKTKDGVEYESFWGSIVDWQPHLNIEQAMMVAEAFDCYEIGKDMSSAAPYCCQFFTGVGGPMIGQAIGMELPYAICRAALAAKEG